MNSWFWPVLFHSFRMGSNSESTPLLGHNDHIDTHTDIESHSSQTSLVDTRLNLAIKVLIVIVSLLSLADLGLLIASYILIETGPFYWIWGVEELLRHQGICVSRFRLCSPSLIALFRFTSQALCLYYPLVVCNPYLQCTNDLPTDPNNYQHSYKHHDIDFDYCLFAPDIRKYPARLSVLPTLHPFNRRMCSGKGSY